MNDQRTTAAREELETFEKKVFEPAREKIDKFLQSGWITAAPSGGANSPRNLALDLEFFVDVLRLMLKNDILKDEGSRAAVESLCAFADGITASWEILLDQYNAALADIYWQDVQNWKERAEAEKKEHAKDFKTLCEKVLVPANNKLREEYERLTKGEE